MRVVSMNLGWVLIVGVVISSCSKERVLGFSEDGDGAGQGGSDGDGQGAGLGAQTSGGAGGSSKAGSFWGGGAGVPAGGRLGSGGTGDDPPRAGAPVSGSGGSSGTGNGPEPQGGCRNEDLPERLEFPQCAEDPFYMEGSYCSEADTREVLECGKPGSTFDPACCQRPTCEEDADCGADAVCIPRPTQAPIGIAGSLVDGCHMECGSCTCSVTADIDLRAYCISANEDVAAFDCNIEGLDCNALLAFHGTVTAEEALYDPFVAGGQYEERMNACADKIEAALATECRETLCDCEGSDCRASVAAMCPAESEFGCPTSLDSMEKASAICAFDGDLGVYQECDQAVSFQWTEGRENDYELTFDRSTRNLQYGRATGYVSALCSSAPSETTLTVVAGFEPIRRSNCRSCSFCNWTTNPEFEGPPPCVFDGEGRIALPPR